MIKVEHARFFQNTGVSIVWTWCLYCMFMFGSYWTRKEGKRVSLVNTWVWQSTTCSYWNSGKKPIATTRRFKQVLVPLLYTDSQQTYALMIFSVKKKNLLKILLSTSNAFCSINNNDSFGESTFWRYFNNSN